MRKSLRIEVWNSKLKQPLSQSIMSLLFFGQRKGTQVCTIYRTSIKLRFPNIDPMDAVPCLWWMLLIISITFLAQQESQLQAHKISFKHHQKRPSTNVTKNLHFPNFHSSNPELKCIGNARISEDKGAIQIPHASPQLEVEPQTYQVGRALYSSHIRLYDPLTLTPASFQTTFSFQFTNSTTNRGGNGLAFIRSLQSSLTLATTHSLVIPTTITLGST